ncbi:hypothetical protein [Erythrobacter sp. MTPC3]|uniref:hypothetical protein n=1 Tax=Erythrobacter sp. MTPC3 TaxID=3056564 RepID=UPI0036F34410
MPKRKTSKALARTKSTAPALQQRFAIADTEIRPEQFYRLPERQPTERGPWSDEPEKIAWKDHETGLDCIILRQENSTLSGYVSVDPDHPLHGYNHDALPRAVRNVCHGCVDYAEPCRKYGPEAVRVCHIRPTGTPSHAPGEDHHDDKWWFGFRTSHSGDLVPVGMKPHRHREEGEVYRDMHFVFHEVRNLARALKAFTHRPVEGSSKPLQIGSRAIDEDQA